MNDDTRRFCRDSITRAIEETYDDPCSVDGSLAAEIAFLRSCAADLGVNFDEVIAGIPESERRRMDEMLKLKKDDRWKQATPMDQLTVILMSLEGWMDLVDPAFVDAEKLLEKVKEHVDQLVALKPFLQQWHW